MNVDDVPVVGRILLAGPNDPVFDTLLLVGPVAVGVVALAGRSAPSILVALAYVLAVAAKVLYNATR